MVALTGLGAPAMKFQPGCTVFILTLRQARNKFYYTFLEKNGCHWFAAGINYAELVIAERVPQGISKSLESKRLHAKSA